LNDPFELKSVNLCDPVHQKAFEGIEELDFEGYTAAMARQFGVLCFSEEKSVWVSTSLRVKESSGVCSM
jgi:hypothetical protein